MRGSDGKLCFNEEEGGKVWKDYMKKTMNAENDWDHNVDEDAVKGPIDCISRDEMVKASNDKKTEKTH